MKRTISIMLAVLMLVSMIPLSAVAEIDYDHYKYYIEDIDGYYMFCGLDVEDSDGLRSVQYDIEISVKPNDDVIFTLFYDHNTYEVDETYGWDSAGSGVLCMSTSSNDGGRDEVLKLPTLKKKAAIDGYTVTIQGNSDGYTGLYVSDCTSGEDFYDLEFGEPFDITPYGEFYVVAYYDFENYKIIDNLGVWYDSGDQIFTDILTAGGADESLTLTVPELTEKSTSFTVTVQGENYGCFEVYDSSTGKKHILYHGESCEITPEQDYTVDAYYDSETYKIINFDGWSGGDGHIYKDELTAGDAGESITITAPALSDNEFTVTVNAIGYQEVIVYQNGATVQNIGGKYTVKPGSNVEIICGFDSNQSEPSSLPEGWKVIDEGKITYTIDEIEGDVTVNAPTLRGRTCYLTVKGEHYNGFEMMDETTGDPILDKDGKYPVEWNKNFTMIAKFDSDIYMVTDEELDSTWSRFGDDGILRTWCIDKDTELTLPKLTQKVKAHITVNSSDYDTIVVTADGKDVELSDGRYPVEPGSAVVITAKFNPDSFLLPAPLPDGWEKKGTDAVTYTIDSVDGDRTVTAPILKDFNAYKSEAETAIAVYYNNCGVKLMDIDNCVDNAKFQINFAKTPAQVDEIVANAKSYIDQKVAEVTQYGYRLTKTPVLGGANGTYEKYAFYIQDNGTPKEIKAVGTESVFFQGWYLRTAFQVKTSEQGDGVDIRLISFLDGEYESYTKAGFTIAGVGDIETTYVYETLIANGEEVDITDLGVSDYAFVITTSFSKNDVNSEKTVNVTPFVVKDGSIYTGETYTLSLGELKSFIAE